MRTKDWARLASFLRSRRAALGGLTQGELATKAGVSLGVITDLESGRSRGRYPHKLPRVEAAVDWTPGSAMNVLDGGDPTESGPVVAARPITAQTKADWIQRTEGAPIREEVKREMRDWLEGLPEAAH